MTAGQAASYAPAPLVPERTRLLRAGYASLALAFVALSLSALADGGGLLILGLFSAFLGGALLAFADEAHARMGGWVLVGYFIVCILTFLASTPATVVLGGERYFVNAAPAFFWGPAFSYLVLGLPLVMAAAGLLCVWELGLAPRALLAGCVAGIVLVGILTVVLIPGGMDALDLAKDQRTSSLLASTLGLAALLGAIGAAWAAARPTA